MSVQPDSQPSGRPSMKQLTDQPRPDSPIFSPPFSHSSPGQSPACSVTAPPARSIGRSATVSLSCLTIPQPPSPAPTCLKWVNGNNLPAGQEGGTTPVLKRAFTTRFHEHFETESETSDLTVPPLDRQTTVSRKSAGRGLVSRAATDAAGTPPPVPPRNRDANLIGVWRSRTAAGIESRSAASANLASTARPRLSFRPGRDRSGLAGGTAAPTAAPTGKFVPRVPVRTNAPFGNNPQPSSSLSRSRTVARRKTGPTGPTGPVRWASLQTAILASSSGSSAHESKEAAKPATDVKPNVEPAAAGPKGRLRLVIPETPTLGRKPSLSAAAAAKLTSTTAVSNTPPSSPDGRPGQAGVESGTLDGFLAARMGHALDLVGRHGWMSRENSVHAFARGSGFDFSTSRSSGDDLVLSPAPTSPILEEAEPGSVEITDENVINGRGKDGLGKPQRLRRTAAIVGLVPVGRGWRSGLNTPAPTAEPSGSPVDDFGDLSDADAAIERAVVTDYLRNLADSPDSGSGPESTCITCSECDDYSRMNVMVADGGQTNMTIADSLPTNMTITESGPTNLTVTDNTGQTNLTSSQGSQSRTTDSSSLETGEQDSVTPTSFFMHSNVGGYSGDRTTMMIECPSSGESEFGDADDSAPAPAPSTNSEPGSSVSVDSKQAVAVRPSNPFPRTISRSQVNQLRASRSTLTTLGSRSTMVTAISREHPAYRLSDNLAGRRTASLGQRTSRRQEREKNDFAETRVKMLSREVGFDNNQPPAPLAMCPPRPRETTVWSGFGTGQSANWTTEPTTTVEDEHEPSVPLAENTDDGQEEPAAATGPATTSGLAIPTINVYRPGRTARLRPMTVFPAAFPLRSPREGVTDAGEHSLLVRPDRQAGPGFGSTRRKGKTVGRSGSTRCFGLGFCRLGRRDSHRPERTLTYRAPRPRARPANRRAGHGVAVNPFSTSRLSSTSSSFASYSQDAIAGFSNEYPDRHPHSRFRFAPRSGPTGRTSVRRRRTVTKRTAFGRIRLGVGRGRIHLRRRDRGDGDSVDEMRPEDGFAEVDLRPVAGSSSSSVSMSRRRRRMRRYRDRARRAGRRREGDAADSGSEFDFNSESDSESESEVEDRRRRRNRRNNRPHGRPGRQNHTLGRHRHPSSASTLERMMGALMSFRRRQQKEEEQIFNWTGTDGRTAPAEGEAEARPAKSPDVRNTLSIWASTLGSTAALGRSNTGLGPIAGPSPQSRQASADGLLSPSLSLSSSSSSVSMTAVAATMSISPLPGRKVTIRTRVRPRTVRSRRRVGPRVVNPTTAEAGSAPAASSGVQHASSTRRSLMSISSTLRRRQTKNQHVHPVAGRLMVGIGSKRRQYRISDGPPVLDVDIPEGGWKF